MKISAKKICLINLILTSAFSFLNVPKYKTETATRIKMGSLSNPECSAPVRNMSAKVSRIPFPTRVYSSLWDA